MHRTLIQGNIVERILWDAAGRKARIIFYVYEKGGRIKARVLDFEYVEDVATLAGKAEPQACVLSLGGEARACSVETFVRAESELIASPYVDSNFLYTLGSKPRAPSA